MWVLDLTEEGDRSRVSGSDDGLESAAKNMGLHIQKVLCC